MDVDGPEDQTPGRHTNEASSDLSGSEYQDDSKMQESGDEESEEEEQAPPPKPRGKKKQLMRRDDIEAARSQAHDQAADQPRKRKEIPTPAAASDGNGR